MSQKRLPHLLRMKESGEKFTCLTVYDATFAHVASTQGVDVIFVGDSLGMVIQGHDSTVPVTVDEIVYHTRLAAKGNQGAILMADMPFMSYSTTEQALTNAAKLMAAGAHIIKLEGGAWLSETVAKLVERGIPVCGHLGLTPQSIHLLGGYKVQGRHEKARQQLIEDAKALQDAGMSILVLECVPSDLAREVTALLDIPVIGIGAGKDTDGQVLVLHDALGITPGRTPKFSKNFMKDNAGGIDGAIAQYVDEVKTQSFPAPEHEFSL